ncbi:MAG: thioredoxin domain-containing protein [Chlamydiia bacterium]|nr:thioredoxin domain-containing protein [Chlamydiia bacterium]
MFSRRKWVFIALGIALLGLGGMNLYHAFTLPQAIIIDKSAYPCLGSARAGIELILFEDLRCTACQEFSQKVLPGIQKIYIDSGIAQLLLIPLAFSDSSQRLANAALAVFAQSNALFFPFLQQLFAQFPNGEPSLEELVTLASSLGIQDLSAFVTDVEEDRFNAALKSHLILARRLTRDALHTPALLINRELAEGDSWEEIASQIERARNQEMQSYLR